MKRKYVVLSHDDEDGDYSLHGVVEATTPEGAIKEVAGEADGRWVAVPIRNWHENDRTVETRKPVVKMTKVDPAQQKLVEVPEVPAA